MARRIEVEIIGDSRGLSKSLKSSQGDLNRFSGSISKVGGGLATFAKAGALAGVVIGGAIAVGVKRSIDAASNLNEQINKASVVFAKSGDNVIDWSDELVSSFGISQRAALEATGTFGNMLVPMGFGRDEAAKMSEKMVELAGDMSSFNNASPEDTLEAIRAGLAGESEPLRKFGVFLSDARQKQEALRLGLYKGKGALDANAKAAATYSLILKDTKDAQGDFARTNEGFANAQRVVAAAFENIEAQLGSALLPTVAKATSAFAGFLGKFSEADGASAKLNVLWDALKAGATTAVDGLRSAFEKIDWGSVAASIRGGLERARAAISGVDWTKLAHDSITAISRAIDNAPIGEIVRSITTVVAQAAIRAADAVKAVDWQKLGNSVAAGIGEGIAKANWSKIIEGVVKLLSAIGWAGAAVIVGVAGVIGRAFVGGIEKAIIGLAGLLSGIPGWVKDQLTLKNAASWLAPAGTAIIYGLWNSMKAAWGAVKGWLSSIPGQVIGAFAGAAGWLVSAGRDAIAGFISGIESKLVDLKNTLTSIPGKVVAWKGPPEFDRKMLYASGQLTLAGYIEGIKSQVGALRSTLGGVTSEVKKLQVTLDRIQREREDTDNQAALRAANIAVGAAKKKDEIASAAAQRDAALEAIRVTALNRQLATEQAAADKASALFDTAQSKLKTAREKAASDHQKWLDKLAKQTDAAQAKAAASFDAMAGLIQQAFRAQSDAWTAPAQGLIDAITGRRQTEDLNQAVSDAQAGLADAIESGGDVQGAERTLARAREDIRLQSLQQMASDQEHAHTQEVDAQQRTLDTLLTALRTQFAEQGVTTSKGMQSILDIVNGFAGGFAGAGNTLGAAFAQALSKSIAAAVNDAGDVVESQGGNRGEIVVPPAVVAAAGAGVKSVAAAVGPYAHKMASLAGGGRILSTGAVIVHKGESVIPAGGRGQVNLTINMPNYLGDKNAVAATLVDAINAQQRVGRLRFAG